MADPTYENDLVLLTTFLKHDLMTREAAVTYALNDNTANQSAQVWADSAQIFFCDNWKAQIDTGARVMRTTAIKGDGTSTFTTGLSTDPPTRGLNAMSSTTPNCAILLRKNTAVGGRRNRGRIYLPFMINEGEVDEAGSLSAGVIGDINTDAAAWLSDLESGGDQEFVIANRFYDAPWDNPSRHLVSVNIGEHVTSLTCESVIATQRRRMPR